MSVLNVEAHRPPPKKKHWLKTTIKWLLIVGIIVFIILTVLSKMGGNSDTLKGAIEDYISESSGYDTRILTLNNMSFFPNINFDFEGAELRRDPFQNDPDITIDRAKVTMGFWDTMSRNGRIKDIQISGIHANETTVFEDALKVEHMGILRAESGEPKFTAIGYVGEQEALVEMDMQSKGTEYRPVFEFGDNRTFTLKIGKTALTGQMQNEGAKGLAVSHAKIMFDGQEVATGDVVVSRDSLTQAGLSGAILLSEHKTKLSPLMTFKLSGGKIAVDGHFLRDDINMKDFTEDARLSKLINYFQPLFAEDGAALAKDILMQVRGFDDVRCDVVSVDIKGGVLNSVTQNKDAPECME